MPARQACGIDRTEERQDQGGQPKLFAISQKKGQRRVVAIHGIAVNNPFKSEKAILDAIPRKHKGREQPNHQPEHDGWVLFVTIGQCGNQCPLSHNPD